MAYDFLKKLFGEPKEGEEEARLSFSELEAALNAAEDLKLVNLNGGDYVDKNKFDKKVVELSETKKLLSDANEEIGKYKEMDIDGIKNSVKDWETKYNEDTKALNDKLAKQERTFAADKFLNNYKFSSIYAKEAVMNKFLSKELPMGDDGKFLGAEDFINEIKTNDPGAFMAEPEPNPTPAPPAFSNGKPTTPPDAKTKMTLTEKMAYVAKHPGTDIGSLFE